MRFPKRHIGTLLCAWALTAGASPVDHVAGEAIVQIRAHSSHAGVVLGSAVVTAPGTLVTNCHVVQGARRVEVVHGGRASLATIAARNGSRDLCFLHVPGLKATVLPRPGILEVGQKVFAAGFPADKSLTVSEGRVVALHEYDGSEVIQVSAPFDHGASGGALLDEHGRLVGIITFKALAGGSFHFAAPVRWVDHPAAADNGVERQPFWQAVPEKLPYFLRAASREAAGDWSGLRTVAMTWIANAPDSPGARRALRTAVGPVGAEGEQARISADVPHRRHGEQRVRSIDSLVAASRHSATLGE